MYHAITKSEKYLLPGALTVNDLNTFSFKSWYVNKCQPSKGLRDKWNEYLIHF